ncbi:MAG TPA: tetratricopeptide repeat protein [Candidatus Acidoferrales bacterium]|nr:tetratricopeptide repeat protein [Candidatus Acidoferrales bacterium]
MKPKKHFPKKAHSTDKKNATPEKPAFKISQRRLWLFRIFAAILVPLMIVGGLELGLRLSGYGYPTNFFLRTKINGQDYYVSNDRFGYRFFPPALARTPVPLRMPVKKPAGAYRIFLFGESAAQGDPDPTFGAGRYLQVLLRERFPGTDFEVVCVAMTAINSHAILPIARECARCDGDLWIIYMGNNEMVGPFGAATVFGPRAPSVSLVRADLAIKATKIGQLLDNLMQHWGAHASTPKTWSGLNMFKNNQLRYDDPSRLRAYENFKRNLADILRVGNSVGVPIILSTVGSNLKDCAPFASLHTTALSETQKTEWDGFYQEGIALESSGDYQQALKQFAQAAAIDPQYAELQFRMGSCDLALTNTAQALGEFELARDDDTLAFRADTRINQIIKDAADEQAGKGVHFLDAAQTLAQNSPDKISGNELFYEHVHLNFDGNYLLGRAFAEQTLKLLPMLILAQDKGEWASAELCDRRLGVSPWDRYRVWQENYSRISEPPFTDQLNDVPRAKFYMAKLKELESQMTEEASKQFRAIYEESLALTPGDYFLRENFAQFLDETGDLAEAPKQEQQVSELLPQNPMTPCIIGRLLVRLGDTSGAEKCFSRALAIRSDYVPALNEMGLILANQQKTAEAARFFERVIQADPGNFETYLNLGFMEQCDGKLDQAMVHYHEAADLQLNAPADYFYRAVASAAELRNDDSISYFRDAVWMNPNFWQARYLLGMELAEAGKIDEAQAQFSEVVRIRPDFERAHLNYGVALAKLGKLDAALKEFQITLQLNPTNKFAQQNLETVQANIQVLKTRSQ